MPFRFSVESVLSFRKNVEHAEELTLMRIVQAITSMNHDLEQIDLRRQDLRQRRDRDLKDGVSAVELQRTRRRPGPPGSRPAQERSTAGKSSTKTAGHISRRPSRPRSPKSKSRRPPSQVRTRATAPGPERSRRHFPVALCESKQINLQNH